MPASELVELCALDNELYCKTFFPNTFRQSIPSFHVGIWRDLENQQSRQVAIKVFRGGAKTTLLRTYTSKRIAYGTSRLVAFTSVSQDHAKSSLNWLRRAVEFNSKWADTYGLKPGKKWSDLHLEIEHTVLGITISVVAVGITGQVRGINLNDRRPDLIVCDDPQDDENSGTVEQRAKLENLFFGALLQGLTPASECPDAKMVLLQTPMNSEDLVNKCEQDPSWTSVSYGILDDQEESRWESRYPTEGVLKERREYDKRGQLYIWLREKQCLIISQATTYFRGEWLKYWDALPERMVKVIAIDPVPPPSETQTQRGLEKRDFEVVGVVGMAKGNFYLLEYKKSRGHQPDWTEAAFFELLSKWKPLKARVEGIVYQKTLKWILEQGMRKRHRYVQIDAPDDKRKKSHRIMQAFSGIASSGRFYIHPSMMDFKEQFVSYPHLVHDDILDMCALGLSTLEEIDIVEELDETEDKAIGLGEEWRTAP